MHDQTNTSINPTGAFVSTISESNIVWWQKFTRVVIGPLFYAMNRGTDMRLNKADMTNEFSYVIASNHQSQLDSFIILASFPAAVYNKLAPFRAMTHNGVLKGGMLTGYLVRMGCFPAKPHKKLANGISGATGALMQHHSVYICPEGWLTRKGGLPAKPGVALLAQQPNTRVIYAHIEWKNYGRILRTFKLTLSKPVDASKLTPEQILEQIYSLPHTSK